MPGTAVTYISGQVHAARLKGRVPAHVEALGDPIAHGEAGGDLT